MSEIENNVENNVENNSEATENAGIPGLSEALNVSGDADAPVASGNTVRPLRAAGEAKNGWWWGTGRRKAAVARVRIRPSDAGKVQVQVNRSKMKTIEEYFTETRDRNDCNAPLDVTGLAGKVDVIVRLDGGGFMGQAQALRLGLARALREYDPTLEEALREQGFLTRDARKVERKKYGQRGARRRFQFSKR